MQGRNDIALCTTRGSKLRRKLQGYAESLRKRAVEMDVNGMNLLVPDKVQELEMDELFLHRR